MAQRYLRHLVLLPVRLEGTVNLDARSANTTAGPQKEAFLLGAPFASIGRGFHPRTRGLAARLGRVAARPSPLTPQGA